MIASDQCYILLNPGTFCWYFTQHCLYQQEEKIVIFIMEKELNFSKLQQMAGHLGKLYLSHTVYTTLMLTHWTLCSHLLKALHIPVDCTASRQPRYPCKCKNRMDSLHVFITVAYERQLVCHFYHSSKSSWSSSVLWQKQIDLHCPEETDSR